MDRRDFLKIGGGMVTAVSGCGGGGGTTQPPVAQAPNVLMIALDDLNDWVGFLGGHPQVKTPNLDRLAARSSIFEHAYCTLPICAASRAGALTGLLPKSTGVYDNSTTYRAVNPGKPMLSDLMAAAGYETREIGKIDHTFNAGTQPLPDQPVANKVCPAPSPGSGAFDWGVSPGTDADLPDYRFASSAIDFLRASHSQPFYLGVGFIRTHVAWYAPARFFDLYPLASLSVPTVPSDDLDDLGPVARATALKFNFHQCITSQDLWAEAVQGYLASISWVDSQVGRVLDALDASPHANNTLVVLWSDHGFHLGEKFHWHKLALWEPATRVPFLVRAPGQTTSQRLTPCVSLADLVPTILDYAGIAPRTTMDGSSLRPVIAAPAAHADRNVLMSNNRTDHALRTGRWRYIRYGTSERELYDLTADPREFRNLAGDSAYASLIADFDTRLPAAS
jgi:arylsulfatase A-like enzyme